VSAAAAADFAQERASAELRAAARAGVAVQAGRGDAWVVVRESDARLRPAPLHRFLRVHPVSETAGLGPALRPLSAHLAGVAVEGFGSEAAEVARLLSRLGASRVCAAGRLQAPPLCWRRGHRDVLRSLSRLSFDSE
jgi:hypothetical protein